MATICYQCNNKMDLVHQTVTHTVFNKQISVHNVPVYHCANCDNAFYHESRHLESKLKEAYRSNNGDISFE